MIPLAILIFGLLIVLVISSVLLLISGMRPLLTWVIPAIPMLAMIGSGILILIEMLLFLGGKDDRRTAVRDLQLLIPTCMLSAVLWLISAFVLKLWR